MAGTGPYRGEAVPLDAEELDRGRRSVLAGRTEADGLWLFGYGALLWAPHEAFDAVERARLSGWRRSFCQWSVLARGTPARPGLGLALVPGEGVEGLALHLPEAALDTAFARIWRMEMYAGLYRPAWAEAAPLDGGPALRALAFVAEPSHPQYAGELSRAEQVSAIREAVGENGSCRDYLAQTVEALTRWRLGDRELEALLAEVDR